MDAYPSRLTRSAVAAALVFSASVTLPGCDRMANLSAEEHIQRAKDMQAEGDAKSSILELKNAIQKDPNSTQARFLLGQLYISAKQGSAAEKELTKARELGIDKETINIPLGEALLLIRDYKRLPSLPSRGTSGMWETHSLNSRQEEPRVVCGINPRNPENILGYRPCVGMVGGTIYFRGPIKGYSERDVRLAELTPQDWEWLTDNIKPFLEAIGRMSYLNELTSSPEDWRKLTAYTPQEKTKKKWFRISTAEFRNTVWEKEVGQGGIFAEYLTHDLTLLPYITTGKDRRNKPVWENEKYAPPCAYACPTHIPTHKRTQLIRQGRLNEALELVLIDTVLCLQQSAVKSARMLASAMSAG